MKFFISLLFFFSLSTQAFASENPEAYKAPLLAAIAKGNAQYVKEALEEFPGLVKLGYTHLEDQGYSADDARVLETALPIHAAAYYGQAEIIHILVRYGAYVNSPNPEPPLHMATRNGHEDAVLALLQNGADPNQIGVFSQTPVGLALAPSNQNQRRPWCTFEMLHWFGAEMPAYLAYEFHQSGTHSFETLRQRWIVQRWILGTALVEATPLFQDVVYHIMVEFFLPMMRSAVYTDAHHFVHSIQAPAEEKKDGIKKRVKERTATMARSISNAIRGALLPR